MEKKLIDSLGGAMFCANRNFYQNSWKIQQGKHDTYQGWRKVLKFGGAYTRCFELTSFFFLYLEKSGDARALTSHSTGLLTPPLLWTDLVKMLTRKLRHASSFSLECTDFKNVIFEKNPWAHSEDAEVAEVKRP